MPHWQKLLDRLLEDKEMLAGVQLKFHNLYQQLDRSPNPSEILETFLAGLPKPKAH